MAWPSRVLPGVQEKMKAPRIIKPKEIPKRDFTRAAWIQYDMDEVAKYLKTVPVRGVFPDKSAFPSRYRSIHFSLADNRYAFLTQTATRPERIEIDLELHNLQLFNEQDLIEVLSILPADIGEVHKIDNGFTWVSAEK